MTGKSDSMEGMVSGGLFSGIVCLGAIPTTGQSEILGWLIT
jgi:hypothetical protein